MSINYQYTTIDMVILALEELYEFYEDPKDKKFVLKRIDYFTSRWSEIKAGLNRPLSHNELTELRLALQTYFEIFERDLTINNDPFRKSWFDSLKTVQKVLTLNG